MIKDTPAELQHYIAPTTKQHVYCSYGTVTPAVGALLHFCGCVFDPAVCGPARKAAQDMDGGGETGSERLRPAQTGSDQLRPAQAGSDRLSRGAA